MDTVETQVVEQAAVAAAVAQFEMSCETQPTSEQIEEVTKSEQNKKVGDFKWQCIDTHGYPYLCSSNFLDLSQYIMHHALSVYCLGMMLHLRVIRVDHFIINMLFFFVRGFHFQDLQYINLRSSCLLGTSHVHVPH